MNQLFFLFESKVFSLISAIYVVLGTIIAFSCKNYTILMKLFVITLISLFALSFTIKDIPDDVANALKQGNVSELVKHFADKVSIKVLDQEDLLSKSQTQALIQDFFIKHKVKGYQTSHTSIVNGNQQFITGTLDTNNGKFRISILVRGSVISQFRIENDND